MGPRTPAPLTPQLSIERELLSGAETGLELRRAVDVSPPPSLSDKHEWYQKVQNEMNQCPYATNKMIEKAEEEFAKIQAHYPLLANTSCSKQFCQGGRTIHTAETRVGYDRPVEDICAEALDLLHQMRKDNVFSSDRQLSERKAAVVQECMENQGLWRQSHAELEHGIRLAWKHAKRCIMRGEWTNLSLWDLRHVKTSKDMGTVLLEKLKEAYSAGDIKPSVFIFPPRSRGKPGPRIWNNEVLTFAGYRMDDGTILGDPLSVDLTDAIIELGWTPPAIRTQWDLLPIVTQAEDDVPYITPVDENDFPVVHIEHPQHSLQFQKLGLRWVPAPILCRFGFDIGGVHYTAAPFMGWFMDAEIGVRDLVDEKRYNALPRIVDALQMLKHKNQSLDTAPEYERLACLSRAQAELNYAVYWSFKQSGVMISDSLTAASMYCIFDDEHFREKGFRLPSDPYFLAPPIGSITPLWHRGGAPSYQPKPAIVRHVQNPVNAWRRKKGLANGKHGMDFQSTVSNKSNLNLRTVRITYCSAGVTAAKLAKAVFAALNLQISKSDGEMRLAPVVTLNEVRIEEVGARDVLLVVASSHGRGDVPSNGQAFLRSLEKAEGCDLLQSQVAVFGNGSSSYFDSYNGASKAIESAFRKAGMEFLLPAFEGDSEKENPAWSQLETWIQMLGHSLFGTGSGASSTPPQMPADQSVKTMKMRLLKSLATECSTAEVSSCSKLSMGIKHIVLDVGTEAYCDLATIEIFVPNRNVEVMQALHCLGFPQDVGHLPGAMTWKHFLTHFVNFDQPFASLDWAQELRMTAESSRKLSEVNLLQGLKMLPSDWTQKVDMAEVSASMPMRPARQYSVASSSSTRQGTESQYLVDLFVQTQEGGLFSDQFLSSDRRTQPLQIRFKDSGLRRFLIEENPSAPLIAYVTGSGIAPLSSYLQARIHEIETQSPAARKAIPPVSILAGFKSRDSTLIGNTLDRAIELGIVDMLLLKQSEPHGPVVSNDCRFVQDEMFEPLTRPRILAKLRNPDTKIFACAKPAAAKEFERNLTAILGADIKSVAGDRYVEEIFDAAH